MISTDEGSKEGAIDRVLRRAVAHGKIAGAVVIARRDGVVIHQAAAGHADREAGTPMRDDTRFRLASMTKPIVSVAALACIEAGLLSLDDQVRRFLPGFEPATHGGAVPALTIRHLLTHTAGLDYGFLQLEPSSYEAAGVSDGLDRSGIGMAENLGRLNRVPLRFSPGTAWQYSLATDVLGAVLAAASGMALPGLVERYVTGPLGMRDTGFTSEAARLATPYADPARPGGDLRRMPDPFACSVPDGGTVRFSPGRVLDGAAYASGGVGMIGTASDYMLFLEAIRNGGGAVLSACSAAAFVADAVPTLDLGPTDPGWGFGLGVAVLRNPSAAGTPMRAGSWQWCGLYGTSFWVDPFMGLSVVALTNTAFEGMNGAFTRDLICAAYAEVGG